MTATCLLLVACFAVWFVWRWTVARVDGTSELVLVATLAGLCVVGRVLVTGVPGLEPVTVIVVCASLALGFRLGAAIGMIGVAVSDVVGGLGPWTAWQMVGFALVAAIAACACPHAERLALPTASSRIALAALVGFAAFVYDLLLDASQLVLFTGDGQSYGKLLIVGLPIMVIHVCVSATFGAVAGPSVLAVLGRARRRLGGVTVAVS